MLHVLQYFFVVNVAWKLVEDTVYVKPVDGPSNGRHEEEAKKDEKKPEEEKEASTSEGNYRKLFHSSYNDR